MIKSDHEGNMMNKTKKFQLKKEIAQDCVYRRLSLFTGGGMQIVPPPFYFNHNNTELKGEVL